MIFAASNIAWAPTERHAAYALLTAHGCTGLEIAPGLLFPDADDPFDPGKVRIAKALSEAADAGLAMVSMQSLLFGVEGAALFGDAAARTRLTDALRRAVDLAAALGIANLVFGSPAQRRYPDGMARADAAARAAETLRPVADHAVASRTVLAMECNPAAYGTNFLTTPEETLAFVHLADHPGLTLNFDIGALHLADSFGRIAPLAAEAAPRISHVHLSEPHLAPAPRDAATASKTLSALAGIGYDRAISIEMRAAAPALATLETCLTRLSDARAGIAAGETL